MEAGYSIWRRRHVRMKASRRRYCLRLPVLGSMGASGSGLSNWASKRFCQYWSVASSSGVGVAVPSGWSAAWAAAYASGLDGSKMRWVSAQAFLKRS